MFDFLLRALIHPADYLSALNKREIIFEGKTDEGDGVYTFTFKPKKPFAWKAGQHAVFTMPEKKISGRTWRPFSIASSPYEQVIKIGTIIKEEPSDFKKHLLSLTPGESIQINGPFGEFHATGKAQQIIGIAGGIGITPFRALAHDVAKGHLSDTKLTLIYSAREEYTYKFELENWQNANLKVIYVHTAEEVNTALQEQNEIFGNTADYYISGSPGMIGALRKSCRSMGIKKIVNDPFKGY